MWCYGRVGRGQGDVAFYACTAPQTSREYPVANIGAHTGPDPKGFLGGSGGLDVVHGSQAGGDNPFAQLWMVYARADYRWAGVDLVG